MINVLYMYEIYDGQFLFNRTWHNTWFSIWKSKNMEFRCLCVNLNTKNYRKCFLFQFQLKTHWNVSPLQPLILSLTCCIRLTQFSCVPQLSVYNLPKIAWNINFISWKIFLKFNIPISSSTLFCRGSTFVAYILNHFKSLSWQF